MQRRRSYYPLQSLGSLVAFLAMSFPRVVAEETIADFLSTFAASLQSFVNERRYLCMNRTEMRGFYFAHAEPCQLTFFGSKNNDPQKACSDSARQIGTTLAYWSRNATDGDEGDEAKQLSASSLALHFWPDSCVGVRPRCFSLGHEKFNITLQRLQEESHFPLVPDKATHLLVDCRNDSQKVFDVDPLDIIKFFDDVESVARRIAFTIMLVCLTWAALGCFCCCCCLKTKKLRGQPPGFTATNNYPPQRMPVPDGVNPDDVNAILLEEDGFIDARLGRQGLRHRPHARMTHCLIDSDPLCGNKRMAFTCSLSVARKL